MPQIKSIEAIADRQSVSVETVMVELLLGVEEGVDTTKLVASPDCDCSVGTAVMTGLLATGAGVPVL